MWNSGHAGSTRGAYEAVNTTFDEHSDTETLADDCELALVSGHDEAKPYYSADELARDDPLHEENSHGRWKLRANPPAPLNLSEGTDEGVGLMNDEANVALVTGAAISPRWARAGKQTVSWLVWPLPSYTHRFFGVRYPDEPRRSTDYLDGMRGVASLFVFFAHYLLGVHDNFVHQGYAYEDNWNILQLPFVRTLYAGSAMVSIFFVISGYVLSQRCVVAMRAYQQDKLHTALTSMTFRRAIRLFLPSVVVMGFALVLVLLGLIEPEHPKNWSWWAEFRNFGFHLNDDLLNLWYWEEVWMHNWYAYQLWTIPIEYRCSMVLFIFILMVARTKTAVRYTIEGFSLVYLFYAERWDAALFLAGMIIAELNLYVEARQKLQAEAGTDIDESEKDHENGTVWSKTKKTTIFLWTMLGVGFYLTGYPDTDARHTPGYSFIAKIWGGNDWDYKFRFWLSQSAILIVLAVSFLPKAQAFFSTPIARYLGKISYALYLVHELMNKTIRVMMWGIFWNVLKYKKEDGREGLKFEGGWILGSIFYIPLVLWAADVFWRAVDVPTVKFAKWFEGKCFVKNKD